MTTQTQEVAMTRAQMVEAINSSSRSLVAYAAGDIQHLSSYLPGEIKQVDGRETVVINYIPFNASKSDAYAELERVCSKNNLSVHRIVSRNTVKEMRAYGQKFIDEASRLEAYVQQPATDEPHVNAALESLSQISGVNVIDLRRRK